jgi:hypothetical protein
LKVVSGGFWIELRYNQRLSRKQPSQAHFRTFPHKKHPPGFIPGVTPAKSLS